MADHLHAGSASSGAVVVELCVESVAQAELAPRFGLDRVELCSALSEGGLTPSAGLVTAVLRRLPATGVQVMIRPRGGDFRYGPTEVEAMLADITALRRQVRHRSVVMPPVGIVTGALTGGGHLDLPVLQELMDAAGPLPVTVHKAFDEVDDQRAALEQLVRLGVVRVLTSGGAPSAVAGVARLAELQRQAAGRIAILAGGGIRAGALGPVLDAGVREVHFYPGRDPAMDAAEVIAAVIGELRRRGHRGPPRSA